MLPAGAPTRAQLAVAGVRPLKRGERDKADLLEVDLGSGPLVIKDFGPKAWWVRWLGRLQIWREVRAYRALGAMRGVPRMLGRVDAYAVAFEKVDGRPLGYAPDRTTEGPAKLRQLREILDRIHAAGVVHWDLRARENVLADRRGEVFVVDFASAVRLRPGGWAHRLLFDRFRLIDESAYLKWKRILEAGPYTAEERAFLERFRFWRSLWFHRRGSWRGGMKRPS
jgi:hypothetical protein